MDEITKMRVTVHNGRFNQNGVYSAKHNDRNFVLDHAEHIDKSKTNNNYTYNFFGDKSYTFEQVERRFYNAVFTDALNAKNQRYIDQRHPERVKTMDDIRTMKRYCPSECILQVGKLGDTIQASELEAICKEYLAWHKETYPNTVILNAAIHQDEQGAPHMHFRCAWLGHDKDGNLVPNQTKALAEMHIDRPDPTKPKSKYNAPIMTYTKQTRVKFIEICRARGLQIEDQPQHASRTGLSLYDYKARQAEQQAIAAEASKAAAKHQAQILKNMLNAKTAAIIKRVDALQDNQYFDILTPTKVIPRREEKCILGRVTQDAEPMYYCYTQEQIDSIRQAMLEIDNLRDEYNYYQSIARELTQSIDAATASSTKVHDQTVARAVDDALKPVQADVRRLQNRVNTLIDENIQIKSSSEWDKRIVERMDSNTYHKTTKILKMEDAYSNREANSLTGLCYVRWGKNSKSNDKMHITEFLELYRSTCKNANVKPNNTMMQHLDNLHHIEEMYHNRQSPCR